MKMQRPWVWRVESGTVCCVSLAPWEAVHLRPKRPPFFLNRHLNSCLQCCVRNWHVKNLDYDSTPRMLLTMELSWRCEDHDFQRLHTEEHNNCFAKFWGQPHSWCWRAVKVHLDSTLCFPPQEPTPFSGDLAKENGTYTLGMCSWCVCRCVYFLLVPSSNQSLP